MPGKGVFFSMKSKSMSAFPQKRDQWSRCKWKYSTSEGHSAFYGIATGKWYYSHQFPVPFACCELHNKLGPVVHKYDLAQINHHTVPFSDAWSRDWKSCIIYLFCPNVWKKQVHNGKKLHFFHCAEKKHPSILESVKCNKNASHTTVSQEAFNLSRDVSQKGIVFFNISLIQGHEGKFNTEPTQYIMCTQWCRRQSPHIKNPQAIVFAPGTGALYYTIFR